MKIYLGSDHQGFAQFALRGGRLWQEADAAITPVQPAMLAPGLYLISGGTGGIGRALAARLAAVPGCRVVLAARNLPKDTLPKGIIARALDVADAAAVRETTRGWRDRRPLGEPVPDLAALSSAPRQSAAASL